ncbi:hypothetical protein LTS08_008929 [Lithohypha guttulata]|nr:hypothetical protein LTS08_008929 [Lithohypha guttulata]
MSNLLSKLTDQLSNQNKPQGGQQSPSSGIPHKVNDAMTGQKHPQDYQTQTNTSFAGGEYGGMGGAGYQQSGHLVSTRPNLAKWEDIAATVLASKIMETKDTGQNKDMVVTEDKKDMVVMNSRDTAATEDKKDMVVTDKKNTAATEDKKDMVVMNSRDTAVTDDNEDTELIGNHKVKAIFERIRDT